MSRAQKKALPPRVSVLMANYNGERFLGAAIDSILFQSFADFEFVIVDDGSTDKSVSLLRSYATRDKRIRVFYFPKNRGFAPALNYGLSFSRGEYIARMDSDDLCHRDRLLKQVSYLDKHREIHVLGCSYRAIDEQGSFCSDAYARYFKKPIPISFGKRRIAEDILFDSYPVLHATIVYRRLTLVSVGGYREFFPIGEDNDLYFRFLNLYGEVLDNLSEKLYYYRHHGSSVTQRARYPLTGLIVRMIALSSEFRRRSFWDPLESCSSANNKSLRYRGVSSFLFLQDSLVFLPRCPRARLYHLLHVVMILRRFRLKSFPDISLWNEWGITLKKQIFFYFSFCVMCFRLRKFRAGFLYLCHILSLLITKGVVKGVAKSFFNPIFKILKLLSYGPDRHLRYFRSFIFTIRWYRGLAHLFFAFCSGPFYTMKFFVVHFVRVAFPSFLKFRN